MADKHAAAHTSTTWPAPAATTPKVPRQTRGDAQGNGRKTASQRLRAHRGLTLHIDEPDKEPTSPMEATPVSAFVRIGDSRPTSAGLYGIKQEGGGNAATNQPEAILIAVVARHHLQAREIAGECAVVRTSAIRRYSPLLNEDIPYYFTSTEPYYSREKPQKGEKDSESISRFFLQLTLATTGTMWFTSSPSLKGHPDSPGSEPN